MPVPLCLRRRRCEDGHWNYLEQEKDQKSWSHAPSSIITWFWSLFQLILRMKTSILVEKEGVKMPEAGDKKSDRLAGSMVRPVRRPA